MPACMKTTSPLKGMRKTETIRSTIANRIGSAPENEESNLYEYLSAEIVALREKKDEFQTKNL